MKDSSELVRPWPGSWALSWISGSDYKEGMALAQLIPTWRDPAEVADWARDVPRDKEIVVYCVYGHEVGRATALRLHAQGVKARFLSGGIDAWEAAGRPVDGKGASS